MSNCAYLLVNNIQMYRIWCVFLDLQSIHPMMKLSSLFDTPVKDNNNCARNWLKLIARTLSMYLFSSY